jgi:hypothetical protein
MFFRRTPKNRYLGREYVLDVKLRSNQVRAARTRLVVGVLGTLLGVAAGGFVVWRGGAWALDRMVYENPAFAIQQLDLQTDGVIATDQLQRWAAINGNENLLALDLGQVKRNLEGIPFIQNVSVERVLPHTLRIRVTEREPVAQIYGPRPRSAGLAQPVVFHVDAEGIIMPLLEGRQRAIPPNPAAEQLPLITGVQTIELQPGKILDVPQIRSALQLILCFDRSQMAQFVDLKRVDAGSPEVLVVTTGQGSEITFGLASLDQQMRRWHDIYDLAQKTGKGIFSMDLAVANNIPARWVEASTLPPTPPKGPKSLRIRKKHV